MLKRLVVLSAILLASPGAALASPIQGLFNTGVNSSGLVLVGGGAQDSHWTFLGGPTFTAPLSSFYVQEPPGSVSRWINSNGQEGNQPTSYTLNLRFDLTGFNPGTASIAGRFAVDNCGSIKLNGTTGGTIANCDSLDSFGQFTAFAFGSNFLPGVNTIAFEIVNAPNTLSAGRVEFTASSVQALVDPGPAPSPVPEPATATLVGIGMAAAAWRRRRA